MYPRTIRTQGIQKSVSTPGFTLTPYLSYNLNIGTKFAARCLKHFSKSALVLTTCQSVPFHISITATYYEANEAVVYTTYRIYILHNFIIFIKMVRYTLYLLSPPPYIQFLIPVLNVFAEQNF